MKKLILFFFIGINVCNGYAQNAARSDNNNPNPNGSSSGCKIIIKSPELYEGISINTLLISKKTSDKDALAIVRKNVFNTWEDFPSSECVKKYNDCADEYTTTEEIVEVYIKTFEGNFKTWSVVIKRKTACVDAVENESSINLYFIK